METFHTKKRSRGGGSALKVVWFMLFKVLGGCGLLGIM
jgi:hypothetical protein